MLKPPSSAAVTTLAKYPQGFGKIIKAFLFIYVK
jgi:hypothetical protein